MKLLASVLFLGLALTAFADPDPVPASSTVASGPGTGFPRGAVALDAPRPYWVTADFSFTSAYVFRGLTLANASFAPSLEAGSGDVYAGLYSNQPLRGHQGDEFDGYAGYRHEFFDGLVGGVSGTYYHYPDASGTATRETYEAGVDVAYSFRRLTAAAYYFHNFRMKSDSFQASLLYSYPLDRLNASLDVSATLGTVHASDWFPDAGGAGFVQSYRYHGFTAALPLRLTGHATFMVGANYSHNDNFVPGYTDRDKFWWTSSLRLGF